MYKLLKLLTGEEIVAKVTESDTHFFLEWPAKVYTTPDIQDPNMPRTRVEPFTPFVKGHSIYVSKSKVLYVAEPVPSLEDYYVKNYGMLAPSSTPVKELADTSDVTDNIAA